MHGALEGYPRLAAGDGVMFLTRMMTLQMVRYSRRSWWEALYRDGTIISEWQTLTHTLLTPFGKGATSRWEDVERRGLVSLRLLCPNGQAGELWAPDGGQFFQLKVGAWSAGEPYSFCDAHIIGVVTDAAGHCLCRAWEVYAQQLIEFTDDVRHFAYRQIGPLALEVLGLRL